MGACLIVNGRDPERFYQAVKVIKSMGGAVSPLPFDVTDEIAVQNTFVEIREKYGGLDILVNCKRRARSVNPHTCR
ncbi:MAG: SDR family NAD(P)-dependent oxidoreductase [Scytolyngbya sp. HA4215-MV1]|nr:SDR family NAD(P)-dependent oxidoreductase [Scytolyngbya sp. HA4215-MV1]